MFKEWLRKLKREAEAKKESEKGSATEGTINYPNRFVKFYHLNKERLNRERRSGYSERKKQGICVRCKRKSLPGIVFCEHHQDKQKEYNLKARGK